MLGLLLNRDFPAINYDNVVLLIFLETSTTMTCFFHHGIFFSSWLHCKRINSTLYCLDLSSNQEPYVMERVKKLMFPRCHFLFFVSLHLSLSLNLPLENKLICCLLICAIPTSLCQKKKYIVKNFRCEANFRKWGVFNCWQRLTIPCTAKL